jgi:Cof subfamily protein (haloacid dehalogenase superfamily)
VRYQLLALDLDGTVVNHDLTIDPRVNAAIAAAQAAGIIVTIATGRMYGAALPFATALNIQQPLICYQGAVIREAPSGHIRYAMTMPGAVTAEAVQMLLERDIFVVAYIDEVLHIAQRRPELDLYLSYHPEGAEVRLCDDLPAVVAEHPATKLLFVAEPEIVGPTLAELQRAVGDRLVTTRSHQLFGELTALGVSKGRALAELAQQLGIPQAAVVAIGDQENDLEMVAWAGLGLAMGNAIPALKAIANQTIPSIDDAGVAWAIKHLLLDATAQ